jgi:very-short-patch-repair endonuclease
VISTRAKKRLELFTSISSSDIVIPDSFNRGIVSLKDYLEYAETGRLPDRGQLTDREPESDFEVAVAEELKRVGYMVTPQVGVAGFFIDIGVHSKMRPGEYLLGVECDGRSCHSTRSIRDRDRLRQDILESKGWKIHRIWSTDWFRNRNSEIQRLLRAVQQAEALPAEREFAPES